MRKLLPVILVSVLLAVGIFLLTLGLGRSDPETGITTGDSDIAGLPLEPSLLLSLEGPGKGRVGQILPVTLDIQGTQPVADLTVEVAISPLYLRVKDYDTEITGTQVMPLALPENADLKSYDVGDDGVLHYQVSGLGSSVVPSRTLLLIPVTPVMPGLGEIVIQSVSAYAPDGNELVVYPEKSLLEIEISSETTHIELSPALLPLCLSHSEGKAPFVY